MIKLLFSIINKIKSDYHIIQNILYLRKIKPKYLFYSENKKYQKYAYLLVDTLVKKYPQDIYYVSSDVEDKITDLSVKNFFIGKGLLLNIFF